MKKVRKSIGSILILLIIIGVLGCGDKNKPEPSGSVTPSQNTTSTQTEPITNTESKPDVEIIGDKFENNENARYVVGTVKNNTANKYKFVQVEIDLYDQFGTLVESKLATAKSLEPNGSWTFKVLITEITAESYKFRDITRL